MKVPQIAPLAGMAPLGLRLAPKAQDEKTVAERKWREGIKPPVAQKPCDEGLFGDSHLQRELFK